MRNIFWQNIFCKRICSVYECMMKVCPQVSRNVFWILTYSHIHKFIKLICTPQSCIRMTGFLLKLNSEFISHVTWLMHTWCGLWYSVEWRIYTWHGPFHSVLCYSVTWLIHTWCRPCHSVTWLMHTLCGLWYSVTWLIHTWHVPRYSVLCYSVTWLMHTWHGPCHSVTWLGVTWLVWHM